MPSANLGIYVSSFLLSSPHGGARNTKKPQVIIYRTCPSLRASSARPLLSADVRAVMMLGQSLCHFLTCVSCVGHLVPQTATTCCMDSPVNRK